MASFAGGHTHLDSHVHGGVHAGFDPHWHPPPPDASPNENSEQLSAVLELHAKHVAPPVPQFASDGVSHVKPEQHPIGHEAGVQTHEPPEHTWPDPHVDPPHEHVPDAEQLAVPQSTHITPPVPHVEDDEAMHIPPEQQPLGQDVESQTHEDAPTQCWPTAHAAAPPHMQTPAEVQVFAVIPQFVQADPFVPQAATVGGFVQVDPEQQPNAQLVESHPLQTPPEHVPPPQFEHTPPPDPQSVGELPPVHW